MTRKSQRGCLNVETKESRRQRIGIVVIVLLSAIAAIAQSTGDCAGLDADTRTRALQTVSRNMGTDPVLPVVESEALLPGTCYWQLFIILPHKKGRAIVYVSPDHRFVSPVLWDLTADFSKEDAKLNAQLLTKAQADGAPIRGVENAAVTVVLFSDLQCPFCAAFARIEEEYDRENPGKIRLIFRNNPLPIHRWSKAAALSGICVARQSTNAFWQFQDFLFAKQKETTPDNLGELVNQFLQSSSDVRTDKYVECMASPYPETRLDRDIEEGSAYRIHSTPTLFINGRKYGGFANAREFAAAVDANIHTETAKQEEEKR